jgi:hypothetical protein
MNDMRVATIPKSDQTNADDLIAGPITITISEVAIRGGQEQPVSIFYEGDNGKPYKPCKSMSRVLVAMWGPDAKAYVGRSLTLYRDPSVKWAGMEVGGIRISHMSHIDREHTMALTATKGSRKPFKVMPLEQPTVPAKPDLAALTEAGKKAALIGETAELRTASLKEWFDSLTQPERAAFKPHLAELKKLAESGSAPAPAENF